MAWTSVRNSPVGAPMGLIHCRAAKLVPAGPTSVFWRRCSGVGVLADEVFLVALDAVIALVVPFETMVLLETIVLRGGELIGETGLPFLGGLGAVHP